METMTTAQDAQRAISTAKEISVAAALSVLTRGEQIAAELKEIGALELIAPSIRSEITSFGQMVLSQTDRIKGLLDGKGVPLASANKVTPLKAVG